MTSAADVGKAIDAFDKARNELKALARSKNDGWASDYARKRAGLSNMIAGFAQLGEAFLRERSEDEAATEFASLAADLRSTMEKHQARWPVLMIDHDKPDYRASMDQVDSKTSLVMTFAKSRIRD